MVPRKTKLKFNHSRSVRLATSSICQARSQRCASKAAGSTSTRCVAKATATMCRISAAMAFWSWNRYPEFVEIGPSYARYRFRRSGRGGVGGSHGEERVEGDDDDDDDGDDDDEEEEEEE